MRGARASLPRLVACALCAVAVLGCAGGRAHVPPAAPPRSERPDEGAPAPAETPPTGPAGTSRAGAIGAPWDTAATASGRAAQRAHVYPSGPSPLGQRLVDSLPDPGGVSAERAPAVPAPASAATPVPAAPARSDAAPSIGESGCWEVQLLVTSDRGRAEGLARRVEKELDLAAWVNHAGALYRVRAGGCLSPDGAGQLARQLKEQGYPEAFRVMREGP